MKITVAYGGRSASRKRSERNLLSGADRQALVVALDEVQVVPGPVERLEPRRKPKEQGLTGTVKVVAHVQGARGQRTKHL